MNPKSNSALNESLLPNEFTLSVNPNPDPKTFFISSRKITFPDEIPALDDFEKHQEFQKIKHDINFNFSENLTKPIEKSIFNEIIQNELEKENIEYDDIFNMIRRGAEKNGFFSIKKLFLHQLVEQLSEEININGSMIKIEEKKKIANRLKAVFLKVKLLISVINCLKRNANMKKKNSNYLKILKIKAKSTQLSERYEKTPFYWGSKVKITFYCYFLLILMASFGVFVYGYHHPYDQMSKPVTDLLGIGVNIAFAGKMAILFLVDVLLVLMWRDILTKLREFRFFCRNFNIFFNEHINLHRYSAYLLIIMSIIHAVGHLGGTFISIKNNFEIVKTVIPGKIDEIYSYSGLIFKTVPGITGILMLIILFMILISSIPPIKHKYFQLFGYSHSLYIVFIILLYVHGSQCWFNGGLSYAIPYITPFLIITILHYIKKFAQLFSYTPILDVSFSAKNSVAYLKILKPKFFNITPGQYLFLNCPSISYFEWHPFSIASVGANGVIKLMIKDNGDFTGLLLASLFKKKSDFIVENNFDIKKGKNFHDLYYDFLLNEDELDTIVKKPKKNIVKKPNFLKIGLYGPILAPAVGSLSKKSVIYIGSGVGISPYIVFLDEYLNFLKDHKRIYPGSIIKDKQIINKITNNSNIISEITVQQTSYPQCFKFFEGFESINFYYIARNLDQLSWISYYLHKLFKYDYNRKKVDIKLFLTTKPDKNIKEVDDFLFWRSYLKFEQSHKNFDLRMNFNHFTNLPFKINNQRPNFVKYFKDLVENKQQRDVNVYACAGEDLVKIVDESCRKVNKEHGARFLFYPEMF